MKNLCSLPIFMSVLSQCLFHALTGRSSGRGSPLLAVSDLLKGLSVKVAKEGEAEAKVYREYFEWCGSSSKQKDFEIKSATSQRDKLEAKIAELGSEIEAAQAKIGELTKDISMSESEVSNATSQRKQEAAEFATSEKEMLEVIDVLGKAVVLLEAEVQKNPAVLAQMPGGSIAEVLQSLGLVPDAATFGTQNPGLVQISEDAASSEDDSGAPDSSSYSSHSSGILEVLKGLGDKAQAQLQSLRNAEGDAQHTHDLLVQSLEDQIQADTKDMSEVKADKAAAEEEKASMAADLNVVLADQKRGKKALDLLHATCMQVASDHEAIMKSRAEELKVIKQAIDELARSTSNAAAQTYSLLQLSAGTGAALRKGVGRLRSKIATAVQQLARQQKSAALDQLASRISAAVRMGAASGEDPFLKVKELIVDMINKLTAEGQAEASEKAYCDSEMNKTEEQKTLLDASIKKLIAAIDQDAARSAELKAEVNEYQDELLAMAGEQAELDKMREESHADYLTVKADMEQGLTGVRKALVILRDYYAQAKEETAEASLLQESDEGSDKFEAFMQQPALPATHYQANEAGTSIVGILQVVESDFATSLAKEETEEAALQEAYEKSKHEGAIAKAQMDKDIKWKSQEFVAVDKRIAELTADHETQSNELDAVVEYYAKLKERCVAKPETFEKRTKRRLAEIAGLKEALLALQSEANLLQLRKRRRETDGSISVETS